MDIKTLPINQLEHIRLQFKKVFRVLNNYFAKKEDMDDFLQKQLHLDQEEFNQINLSQKNLGKIFLTFFNNFEDKEKITKKDLGSFLSVLNYNDYGFTKATTISNLLYK